MKFNCIWKALSAKTLSLLPILALVVGCGSGNSNMDAAVKDYLEKNPQVIQAQVEDVLKKKGIRGRAPQKTIDEMIKNPIKVPLNNAPILGPDDAEITIVEFSDFQCPFCKRVVPTMKDLMKNNKGKIKLAFRQNPLSFHKNAMPAAKASLAANEQGKFWEMHDALFNDQRNLSEENILKIAKDLGLNMDQFKKDFKSDKFDAQIQADIKWAQSNGASGTPAFFVNGVYVRGAKPLTYFQELVDKLLKKGKSS